MPYTIVDGEIKYVEACLNALGVINRLNSFQIIEMSINFICEQIVHRMKSMTTIKEKEEIFFDIVKRLNEFEYKALKTYYKNLSTKEKRIFFEDVDENGIYIHNKSMDKGTPIFDVIREIYKVYDWIKPYDVYVNKWGRQIKIMKPLVLGDLYMMKLKQSSKKGFSARSTGAISRKGIPEKSFKNKIHQELYSQTPIRIGDQENTNALIGVSPEDVAKLHLFYRSSVIGRRDLGKRLASTIKTLKDFNYDKTFVNRNVEILQAYLKAMGLQIEFMGEMYDIPIESGSLDTFEMMDGLFIGTRTEHEEKLLKQKIINKYKDDVCFVGTNEEYEQLINDEFVFAKENKDMYLIDIKI